MGRMQKDKEKYKRMRSSAWRKSFTHPFEDTAQSSAEAELAAINQGAQEGLFLQAVMEEVGFGKIPVRVYSDSSAARAISHRSGAGKLKHVEIKQFWIQDLIRRKALTVWKVHAKDNIADILTKGVGPSVLETLLPKMGIEFMRFDV